MDSNRSDQPICSLSFRHPTKNISSMSQTTRTSRSRPALVASSLPQLTRRKTAMPSSTLETAGTTIPRQPSHMLKTTEKLISDTPLTRENVVRTHNAHRTSTDAEESSDNGSENDGSDPRWVTVKRGRAQSLDSARKHLQNKNVVFLSKTLSTEQEKVIEAATNSLNSEQREQLKHRQNKVVTQNREDGPVSGPSTMSKGKTVDPREWGAVDISPEEMNVDIQEAMINTYQKNRGNFVAPPVSRQQSINPANTARNQGTGSRPAAQILPDSSLGVALGNLAHSHADPDNPSDPSESSSEYESSYSRSTRSYGSSRSRRRRRRKLKQRSKRKS